jgi:hypothetical protein
VVWADAGDVRATVQVSDPCHLTAAKQEAAATCYFATSLNTPHLHTTGFTTTTLPPSHPRVCPSFATLQY